MSSKAERYVLAKLNGAGSREAARQAGYAGGRPPSTALRLYERVRELRAMPDGARWIERRLQEREEEVRELRATMRAAKLLERAVSSHH
ncbi:hypothetical protein EA187_14390 [Lujinxingia sediminis]|uniref:Terminase small subunit n=1 Tax=Lujinxingia sediminis TaxID=2480984 RepID=A0ABY0CQC4_9DELT|nr:hypothetical protein [Lujinxingia sediminis]RVU42702.1 hypothetical protein EA187_14390 [Lujinxingia sediminis]